MEESILAESSLSIMLKTGLRYSIQPSMPLGLQIPEEECQGKEVSLAHLKDMAQMRWDIAFGIRRVTRSYEAEMSHLMRTLFMKPILQHILFRNHSKPKWELMSEGSKNSESFEDSGRSNEEDSNDETSSKKEGFKTPHVRRSSRESKAPVRLHVMDPHMYELDLVIGEVWMIEVDLDDQDRLTKSIFDVVEK
ncbi:hypothetical protein Tco_0923235 [Tanacetum coccineum]|uniref:Uncharacterized protein n=1 Tax=Tanacetum coccineum TaxID=301880 RepID=A0ABQ5D0K3_9ASTR